MFENTLYKLRNRTKLTLGFFGGDPVNLIV